MKWKNTILGNIASSSTTDEDLKLERLAELIAVKIDSGRSPGLMVHTIDEVAEILKVSRRTVEGHLYEKRDLKYLKVGKEVRIREMDIRKFLGRASF
ncbi:MAG: helix-turn-helix domain-containing protein [Deltaproteobacteria bacterium]|jgi:excisionase family DNA binding protein|nr:helix-turn-helix domain-containing protein [Deltaproteobacteria bacterium]|tara:strand:+ start:825 stop:1115 length:291 start_codon:yes stop_codon:yes gene_type:complete